MDVWHCKCKDCMAFQDYGKHYWCKQHDRPVLPHSQACKEYNGGLILMTENIRFTIDNFGFIFDGEELVEDIVDTLNDLNDENEQLKSEKEHYKKQVDELDGLLNKYEITFEELEEIISNDYRERF